MKFSPTAHIALGPCRKTQKAKPDAACHTTVACSLLLPAMRDITRPTALWTNKPRMRGRAKGRSLCHCSSVLSRRRPGTQPGDRGKYKSPRSVTNCWSWRAWREALLPVAAGGGTLNLLQLAMPSMPITAMMQGAANSQRMCLPAGCRRARVRVYVAARMRGTLAAQYTVHHERAAGNSTTKRRMSDLLNRQHGW